ncbi:MAG: HK97 family phage prohead protease [Patescibacteria group bacterium]|jgi:HK97 family phage prohead protease|nr:HK97 family phage prohead protease [Patescibacteria group bacterium]
MKNKEKNKKHDEITRVRVKARFKIIEKKESKKESENAGIIEAYVSIFNNIDLDGDIIKRGAFADSLKVKYPKGVWMHDWSIPIAKTLKAEEDDEGLLIRAQFNLETQRGKEAYSDIKFGIIDEFSIGFKILDYEWDENDNRIIKKVKLYEWSPVLAGANPKTRLLYIKSLEKVNYIDVDYEKKRAKIYFSNGKAERVELSNKYIKHLKSLVNQKGTKVDVLADNKKIFRIRQAVKQADKACEFILRITK